MKVALSEKAMLFNLIAMLNIFLVISSLISNQRSKSSSLNSLTKKFLSSKNQRYKLTVEIKPNIRKNFHEAKKGQ